jgi:hypothetical protein
MNDRALGRTAVLENVSFGKFHSVQHFHDLSPIDFCMLGRKASSHVNDRARIVAPNGDPINKTHLVEILSLSDATALNDKGGSLRA